MSTFRSASKLTDAKYWFSRLVVLHIIHLSIFRSFQIVLKSFSKVCFDQHYE